MVLLIAAASEINGDVRYFAAGNLENNGLGELFGDVHRHQSLFGLTHDLDLVSLVTLTRLLLALLFGLFISLSLYFCEPCLLSCTFGLGFGGCTLLLSPLLGGNSVGVCLSGNSLCLFCLKFKLQSLAFGGGLCITSGLFSGSLLCGCLVFRRNGLGISRSKMDLAIS